MTTSDLTCKDIKGGGRLCGRPAKALVADDVPVCGVHARWALHRGEEVKPLPKP